jgi:hypothetical protein
MKSKASGSSPVKSINRYDDQRKDYREQTYDQPISPKEPTTPTKSPLFEPTKVQLHHGPTKL